MPALRSPVTVPILESGDWPCLFWMTLRSRPLGWISCGCFDGISWPGAAQQYQLQCDLAKKERQWRHASNATCNALDPWDPWDP